MNYNQIGHESLAAFTQTTQKAITAETFDFVVAASDSGNLAAHITGEVYEALEMPMPPTFIAPIFRHVDKERTILFDNVVSAPQFVDRKGTHLGNVLFVDDEIRQGVTLRGMIDLLVSLEIAVDVCTVIAEDGGFDCGGNIEGVPVHFMPPKRRLTKIYNAFSYTIPQHFYGPVFHALADETLNHKQIMCTLLDLPVKDRTSGIPRFSDHLLQAARAKVAGFTALQLGYTHWLRTTVRGYMNP